MSLRIWTLFGVIALTALALGIGPPQQWIRARQERERDRSVLTAALLDALDPANHEISQPGRLRGMPKYVVLEPESLTLDPWDDASGALASLATEGLIPRSCVSDFTRRNSTRAGLLTDLRIAHPTIVMDVAGGAERYVDENSIIVPDGRFWVFHPQAAGYFSAYMPGYSTSGRQAAVVLRWGPSRHGHMELIRLLNIGNRWTVRFRRVVY
jgi:hypothetical protein